MILMMQAQVISQRDIVLDHICAATGIVPVPHKALFLRIFAKSMRVSTPHVSAVPIRHVGFLGGRCIAAPR